MVSGDTNGIIGGLLMEEGQVWRSHRKILSKLLHLNVLETYIENMDDSGIKLIIYFYYFRKFDLNLKQKVFQSQK